MFVGTAVPTSLVGTALVINVVPTTVVGTGVPTTVVGTTLVINIVPTTVVGIIVPATVFPCKKENVEDFIFKLEEVVETKVA